MSEISENNKPETPEQTAESRPPLSDGGLNAPTLYVDSLMGTMISRNVVKINLIEDRQDLISKDNRRVVIGRLVIPTTQIKSWRRMFERIESELGKKFEVGIEDSNDSQAS